MSDLANRLVTAASPDVWAVTEACTPEQIDMLVRKVVVTVMQELAAEATSFNEDLRLHAHQRRALRALAEVIEKGEQT